MTIQSSVLFDGTGKPTPLLLAQARSKTPLKALQAAIRCVDQGKATPYFIAWWNASFPTRNPLPDEPLADRDGVGTLAFWRVFT